MNSPVWGGAVPKWPGFAFPSGVCFELRGLSRGQAPLPGPQVLKGDWEPRVEGVHVARGGGAQGPPWSRYWSRWRFKGMPAIRSNSFLSSSTVVSARQFVTRNISPVSSSNTRMVKTSGAKSSVRLVACESPPRLPLWARAGGCAEGGRRPAAGSGRRAPPGGLAARAPPAPALSPAARRMATAGPQRASSRLRAAAARHPRPRPRRPSSRPSLQRGRMSRDASETTRKGTGAS